VTPFVAIEANLAYSPVQLSDFIGLESAGEVLVTRE